MRKKLINSQLTNMKTYLMYREEMLTLAENVFEFKNLPEFIDVSYLNKTLLRNGSIAFFKDEVLGLIALPYDVIGNFDIYGRPLEIMCRAANGTYYKKLKRDEFVIMYDNNGRYPIFLDICQMAERISLSKRTIDVNIVQQRTPRIWKTSQDKKRTLQDMLAEIDGMEENIATYESIDIDDMNVVLAPAPFVADKIDLHLDKEWAEFYRLIGVANLIEQKKERMIKDEMSASQGGTIASRFSRFEPRKRAIDEINKKFGTNIEVSYYDGEPTTEEVKELLEEVDLDETESM
ncbi:hypothetical protein [Fusobacterium ulcerans]|uniref:hypothetical protein n=1 Tax=Fusobacterium ulcerans TaxID=861 RepID=UPI002E7637C3|nr:hypothetical protein [Fusobacterium ulcerans]MEE0137746.1 hypothetical protein [Fusobacterium ulcerans]